jgi:hypothetical protein
VPRYYFHLYNDVEILDQEGLELPNEAIALKNAADAAREMAAESVRQGRLVLDHRIVVCDENGTGVGTVYFRDVVQVHKSEAPFLQAVAHQFDRLAQEGHPTTKPPKTY